MDLNILEKWTRAETLELIAAYKKHPNLYRVSHPDYLSHKVKKDSLYEITQTMQKIKPNVDINQIKKKFKTLNRQMRTECKRKDADIARGESMETYTAHLWCFNHLGFLLNASDEADMLHEELPKSPVTISRPLFQAKRKEKVSMETLQNCVQESLQLMGLLLKKAKNKKVESFCSMLSSELKDFKYIETYEAVTTEILHIIRKTKPRKKQERLSQENTYNYSDYDISMEDADPIDVESSPRHLCKKRLLSIDSNSDLMGSRYEHDETEQIEEIVLG